MSGPIETSCIAIPAHILSQKTAFNYNPYTNTSVGPQSQIHMSSLPTEDVLGGVPFLTLVNPVTHERQRTQSSTKPPLVWLATGCSSGFGAEFVRAILEKGDRVVATAPNV